MSIAKHQTILRQIRLRKTFRLASGCRLCSYIGKNEISGSIAEMYEESLTQYPVLLGTIHLF